MMLIITGHRRNHGLMMGEIIGIMIAIRNIRVIVLCIRVIFVDWA